MTCTAPVLALLAVAASAAPAAAPVDWSDPVLVVRALYAREDIRAKEFYSARLNALFERDERLAGGEIGNLDFDFIVAGQDTQDGWERTLSVELVSRDGNRAEIRATFVNFRPVEIRYTLVREGGRWLVDDARAVVGGPWVLSEILAR